MKASRDELRGVAELERLRTLLKESLHLLSNETVKTWMDDLAQAMYGADTPTADRLEANAMLVGIMTCMAEDLEESRRDAEEAKNG